MRVKEDVGLGWRDLRFGVVIVEVVVARIERKVGRCSNAVVVGVVLWFRVLLSE